MIRKSINFPVFFFAAVLSIAIFFLGLKLYFNQAWLNENVSYHIAGSSFVNDIGDAKIAPHDGALKVGSDNFPSQSKISVQGLSIATNFYKSLSINFGNKPSQQSLSLALKLSNFDNEIKKAILYTDTSNISRFNVGELIVPDSILTSISLSTPKLIDNYSINSVTFAPKDIGFLDFIKIIKHDFSQVYKPYHMQKYFLMPAYQFILLYVACLLMCLLLISSWKKGNKIIFWWLTFVATWVSIDLVFVYFKLVENVVSINSYECFFEGLFALSPWLLGIATCLFSFKRRYGVGFLVIGSGYVVGVFVTLIIIAISEYYHYQINWNIVWGSELLLAMLLFYFARLKNCSIDEIRLEKAPPNSHYFYTFILILICVIHLFIFTNNLVFDFLAIKEIAEPLIEPNNFNLISSSQLSIWLNEYFILNMNYPISLVMIWAGLLVALGCATFGGLRYLGVSLLPAMFSCYIVISAPFWLDFSTLELHYINTLSVLCTSLLLFLITSVFCFKEFRLLLLVIPILIIFSLDFSSYISYFNGDIKDISFDNNSLINLSLTEPSIASVLLNDSYILVPAVIGSLFIWLLARNRNDESKGVKVLLYFSTITICFSLYGFLQLSVTNQISLHILHYEIFIVYNLAALVPSCVYHLVTKDEETLPII